MMMKNIFQRQHLSMLLLLLLFCSQGTLLAQESNERETVTGVVSDQTSLPLPGVLVENKSNGSRAVTNAEGRYKVYGTKGDKLSFRFVGMVTKVVTVSGSIMNVQLKEDQTQLDEVVVTGYQKVRSRVYTGAATAVKMAEIKLDGVPDMSRMLEGRIPGLSVQNISGTFGAAPKISIRGGATILGDAQPLWVIDGAVYENMVPLTMDQLASGDAVTLIGSAVSGLNPSDIEDIQVLKDASATSVYGARALNGVIVITTKSGRRGMPLSVTYATENAFRLKPSYREYDLLDSQETMSLYQEMWDKGYFGVKESLYGRRGGIYHQMYRDILTVDPNTGSYLLPNTPKARLEFLQRGEYANTDWFDLLFTYRPTTRHTVTLSGGGDHVATYASIGYYHDGGWTITDGVQQLTAYLKSTFYPKEELKLTLSANGNIRNQRAPGTMPLRRNSRIGAYERDFDINPFAYALSTSRTLTPYDANGNRAYYRNNWAPFNILSEYENNQMQMRVIDFKLQVEGSYKPIQELEVGGLVSIRRAATSTQHEVKEQSNVVLAYQAAETPTVAHENFYLLNDPNNPALQPKVALTHGGILNKTEVGMTSFLGRLSGDYNKKVDEHDIRLFGFSELRSTERFITPFQGYGIQYDKANQVYPNPKVFDKLAQENTPYFSHRSMVDRGVTFSLNATYGYAGKYIFNTVLNYEGANTSGKGAKALWLPTWNIGAKWNLDQEEWLSNHPTISKLALRASYGLTAKMNEEAINTSNIFRMGITNRLHLEDRENALLLDQLENRDLTWEKMYELNVGLEVGMLNNRISGTLDLYQRNTFDLIDLVRTSGVGGQYYKYANFGDMTTRGVELGIHSKNIVTEKFSWSSSLTISGMSQMITRLLNSPNAFDMVAGRGRGNLVGYPKGSLFSFNFQGLDPNGLPTFDFGLYQNSQEHARIVGADFLDTEFNKSYLLYHGPIEPQAMGGLMNTFRYKEWELSLFITMQAGNKIRINPTFDPLYADLNIFSRDYRDRWLSPGDEYHTEVPVLPSQSLIGAIGRENIERAYNTYNFSQNKVADGSFIRLKSISLSYTAQKELLERIRLKGLSVRLNATNPLMLYADKKLNGQDPEYYRTGGVSLPTPKQVTVSMSITF